MMSDTVIYKGTEVAVRHISSRINGTGTSTLVAATAGRHIVILGLNISTTLNATTLFLHDGDSAGTPRLGGEGRTINTNGAWRLQPGLPYAECALGENLDTTIAVVGTPNTDIDLWYGFYDPDLGDGT